MGRPGVYTLKNSFIIVSYFNLLSKNNEITDEWMESRIVLLEAVTLRSLRSQSDQDFLYVLICAEDTPAKYKSKLESIMSLYLSNGVICWITPDMTNAPCNNSELLKGDKGTKILKPFLDVDATGSVYTTHIGSDDALGINFVKAVKTSFDFDHFRYHGFMYFPEGYVYYSEDEEFFSVEDHEYFFLTLREPLSTFRGVLYTDHVRVHRRAPVTKIKMVGGAPMWIKILHTKQIGSSTYPRTWQVRKANTTCVGHGRVMKQFEIDIPGIKLCNT